jgi:hypothetical protein
MQYLLKLFTTPYSARGIFLMRNTRKSLKNKEMKDTLIEMSVFAGLA